MIYKLKLLCSLFYFLALFFLTRSRQACKRYKILIALYIFLFLQITLVIFWPHPIEKPSPLIDHQQHDQQTKETLNLDQVNHYLVNYQLEEIAIEKNRYDLKSAENNNQPTHRDQLINLGIINLALNNEGLCWELTNQAKEIDPNWEGWQQ